MGWSCSGLTEESIQGFDLALFSAGGSTSGEWAPRFVRRRRRRGRQLLAWRMSEDVPLVVARGQPGGARVPPRDHRQPELLDDADGRGAEADPRRRRDRAARDLHLPGGVGHRQEAVDELLDQSHALLHGARDRAAAMPTRTRSRSTRSPTPAASPPGDDHTDEERKLIERDPQDPRRRVDRDQRHVRARARA